MLTVLISSDLCNCVVGKSEPKQAKKFPSTPHEADSSKGALMTQLEVVSETQLRPSQGLHCGSIISPQLPTTETNIVAIKDLRC